MTTEIATTKRNGLAVLWDVLVAPSTAFAELRSFPHWGWAFLVTAIFGAIGGFLQTPASEHVSAYMIAHDPRFATMSAEQIASAKKIGMAVQHFAWAYFPIITIFAIAVTALAFLVANAVGRGSANFAKLFALSANVAFLNFGLGYLLHGIVAALRGPENFQTTADVLNVLPNLGWLVPAGAVKLQAFFSAFNIFQIWSIVLLAFGSRAIAKIPAWLAWTVPISLAVAVGLFTAVNAH